jgi:uncharacterized protein (UPF0147 family)
MEEIDKQRDESTTKQQIMYDSISSVLSTVSKLIAAILAVRIDTYKMRDKLEQTFNQIISILSTTHTSAAESSPPRNISRATKKSPVKLTSPGNESPAPFSGVVTQLKLPASSWDSTAPTWANDCDSDNEDISHSASILMEVDSARLR